MNSFGEFLRKYRADKKISQEELAKVLGTTKQVISRYENNQRSPKVSVVAEYAEKLGVSISEITGDIAPERIVPSPTPDPHEAELIQIYRDLNPRGQDALMRQARYLLGDPEMKNPSASNTTAI